MARTILALGLLVLLIAFIRGAEDDERIRLVYNLHLFSSILKTTVCLLLTFFVYIFCSSRFRSRLRVRPDDRTEDLRDQRQLNRYLIGLFTSYILPIFYMF